MHRLMIASGNAGKIAEIRHILSDLNIEVRTLADLNNPPHIVEDADTFQGNAAIKAETICRLVNMPVLADDSGLEVDALDGRPGVLSARYGGEGLTDAGRYERLLEEISGVSQSHRTARFRCVIALARPGQETLFFDGSVEGTIATAPSGNGGFGYDPVFFPRGLSRSMAALSQEEKKRISHRGAALTQFAEWLAARSNTDEWDLAPLFGSDASFDNALAQAGQKIDVYAQFRGHLGDSIDVLRDCLTHHTDLQRELDRLGSYAFLRSCEDLNDSQRQGLLSRYRNLATRAAEAASFIAPQILAIDSAEIDVWRADRKLENWAVMLERILRMRPHTLSPAEERILAMQGEVRSAAGTIFRQLNDADFRFGTLRDAEGNTVTLTHGNWGTLQESSDRGVRRRSFQKMYAVYEAHANTLAATLEASVQQDVYDARVRGFNSARQASLYDDNVSDTVYDNLIATVRNHIDIHHRYLELVRRRLGVRSVHIYDTAVPLVSPPASHTSWNEAVSLIAAALSPLGENYCRTLTEGLTTARWADRYERRGKRSGAFSAGGYDSPPYILMNYRADSLRSVYTLAHEAGHSMHTHLSARHQPYPHWEYTIFVAEVASTFNEQLLTRHLLSCAADPATRAYIIDREISQIRTTLIRQTMFAEFEKRIHDVVENGEALTLDRLKNEYADLLGVYFGKVLRRDPALEMEWSRIPHFYNAFYVYKYATGIAAAIALSNSVAADGDAARDRYLRFLQSGGSLFPLDQLRLAGVDLTATLPVEQAMKRYETLIDEMESLLG